MSDKKRIKKKKIYIACGGSAGHIFPGLTLAEELVRRHGDNVEVSFITSDSEIARSLFTGQRFNFYALPLCRRREVISPSEIKPVKTGEKRLRDRFFKIGDTTAFFSNLYKNTYFIFNLFRSSVRSIKIIFLSSLDCFVGFGSYVAGPPFMAASLLRVPTLIHEQNAVMGKANRIMRHFATKVALSFPKDFEPKKPNTVITGNPVRESAVRVQDKASARDFLGIGYDKFTILVLGGSQGSRTVNSVAIEVFKGMARQLRNKIQVIHISGQRDYERLKKEYGNMDIRCKIYAFFNDMGVIYSAADIAISRAGASVIFELCAHKIPSILIPYPFAEGHQVQNASFFAKSEAAIVVEEGMLTRASLYSAVIKLMEDKGMRDSMGERMGKFTSFDAAKRLADEVSSLAGLKK